MAGRGACGYGWKNPAGGGLSFHQVSQAGVNVTCAIPTENSNNDMIQCDGYKDPFCQCKIIKTKTTLGRCCKSIMFVIGPSIISYRFRRRGRNRFQDRCRWEENKLDTNNELQ